MRRLMIIAAAVASLAGSAEIGGSAQAGSPLKHGLATKITKRRGKSLTRKQTASQSVCRVCSYPALLGL